MWSTGSPKGRGLFLKGEFRFSLQSVVMSAGCMGRSGVAFGGTRCGKMVMVRWNVELIAAFPLHLSFHLHFEPSPS